MFILFVHLCRWIYFWLLNPSSLMFFQFKLQYYAAVQQHKRLFYCCLCRTQHLDCLAAVMQQKQHLKVSRYYFYCCLCRNTAPRSAQVLFRCCYAAKTAPGNFQVLFLLLFMQKQSTWMCPRMFYCCFALRNFWCYFTEILLLTVQLNSFGHCFEPSLVLSRMSILNLFSPLW